MTSCAASVSSLAPHASSSFFNRSDMDIPRNEAGEVEWNTLGNILTAQSLSEVLLASQVSNSQKSSKDDCNWRFSYEKHNITALQKKIPGSPLRCFMGQGVVSLPLKTVAGFIGHPPSTLLWDRNVADIKVLETLSETEFCQDSIVYMRIEAKRCLVKVKCDFVYFMRCIFKDGKYIRTSVSVEHPSCPVMEGVTRGTIYPGSGWVLQQCPDDSSSTHVSYLAHVDIKDLPSIVINRVLRRHPLFVHYMRTHLEENQSLSPYSFSDEDGWSVVTPNDEEEQCMLVESSPLYFSLGNNLSHSPGPTGLHQMESLQYSSYELPISPAGCEEDCSVLEFESLSRMYEQSRERELRASDDVCQLDTGSCGLENRKSQVCNVRNGALHLPTITEESLSELSCQRPLQYEAEPVNTSVCLGSSSGLSATDRPCGTVSGDMVSLQPPPSSRSLNVRCFGDSCHLAGVKRCADSSVGVGGEGIV